MRDSLKKKIEELVETSIKDFKTNNNLCSKRIILYNSIKLRNDTLILNHTQNRFYNQQFIIDKKTPIEIITHYNRERHFQEGDYVVDVGDFLMKYGVSISELSDF